MNYSRGRRLSDARLGGRFTTAARATASFAKYVTYLSLENPV